MVYILDLTPKEWKKSYYSKCGLTPAASANWELFQMPISEPIWDLDKL